MDRYSFGNVYRTEAECQKAIYRQKAITTLQRSSDFVPDWDDLEEKRWTVCYDYRDKELFAYYTAYIQHGAVAHFRTLDDAEDSIKNHEKEWLIYFGVEDN